MHFWQFLKTFLFFVWSIILKSIRINTKNIYNPRLTRPVPRVNTSFAWRTIIIRRRRRPHRRGFTHKWRICGRRYTSLITTSRRPKGITEKILPHEEVSCEINFVGLVFLGGSFHTKMYFKQGQRANAEETPRGPRTGHDWDERTIQAETHHWVPEIWHTGGKI